jgi:hypothetical protein
LATNKQTLQMDVLRGQSPAMVRKEVWAHLLAYNLVRGLRAQAAHAAGLLPVQLSFKGALKVVNAFTAVLWTACAEELEALCCRLHETIATHTVGNRPNRYEPRRRKRRPKPYPFWRSSCKKSRTRPSSLGEPVSSRRSTSVGGAPRTAISVRFTVPPPVRGTKPAP